MDCRFTRLDEVDMPTIPMTLREAILATADLFDSQPDLYQFAESHVPACGSPGCVIGWIGHFMGVSVGSNLDVVATRMGITERDFYAKMIDAKPAMGRELRTWTWAAPVAAAGLRRMASTLTEDGP
jgi:hypothetical protein